MTNTIWPRLSLALLSFLCLTSCIKEEALNIEADIVSATIEQEMVLLQGKPVIGNNSISFRLKQYAGSYVFAPEFTLTPGASIEPKSGTPLDFIQPQTYTVSSEDGAWEKSYEVSFIVDAVASFTSSFENVDLVRTENPVGLYHEFFEYLPNMQKKKDWDTGNIGYNILLATLLGPGEEASPDLYPTYQTEDGFIGKGALLQTRTTGPLGGLFGSPLAAGNLFIGEFSFTFPAIKSTKFGQNYSSDTPPKSLKGMFKYKAGADFEVNSKPSNLQKDTWDAYAILFEKTGEDLFLEGDHNFQDPRMISVARIKPADRIETDKWTAFEIDFEFLPGKTFDPTKEYLYTIVFSSSLEGDKYNGAIGSTLWIDEVQLVTE